MLFVSKLIPSQKGNALLLVLGLVAVVGSISIEIWNRNEVTLNRSRQSTLKDEADLVMQAFASRLQNPETCTEALAGEIVQPGQRADVAFHYVLDETLDPGATGMGAGSEVASGVVLSTLQIEVPAVEDMRTEILDANGVATALVRYPAYLQATFSDAHGVAVTINRTVRTRTDGSKEMDLGIPIFVWANPIDGQILSCFGRNSAGTVCNDLGGYFMPNTDPYFLSCRQSYKTERRTAAGLVPHGNCRVGGIMTTAGTCNGRFRVPFTANLLQQTHGQFQPAMANQFLCELCQ